jgi:SOS-response transcriptional repressor LexA
MAVKTFRFINDRVYLFSANKNFLPIEIKPYWSFEIQGVVKYVIHDV